MEQLVRGAGCTPYLDIFVLSKACGSELKLVSGRLLAALPSSTGTYSVSRTPQPLDAAGMLRQPSCVDRQLRSRLRPTPRRAALSLFRWSVPRGGDYLHCGPSVPTGGVPRRPALPGTTRRQAGKKGTRRRRHRGDRGERAASRRRKEVGEGDVWVAARGGEREGYRKTVNNPVRIQREGRAPARGVARNSTRW